MTRGRTGGRCRRGITCGVVWTGLALAVTTACTGGPAEQALETLWQRQAGLSDQPAEAAALCQAAVDRGTLGAYAPVGRTLQGWHLLAGGQAAAAAVAWSGALTAADDAVARAADTMARRWLTRVDREQVIAALRAYYAAEVQYPPALDALQTLAPRLSPPLKDRWDAPWNYRLATFRALKGLDAQRYVLESRTLGKASDLAAARAALQAGHAPAVRLVRVVSQRPPVAVEVDVIAGGQTNRAALTEGATAAGVRFVRLVDSFALFSDGDRWLVVWPPGRPGGAP